MTCLPDPPESALGSKLGFEYMPRMRPVRTSSITTPPASSPRNAFSSAFCTSASIVSRRSRPGMGSLRARLVDDALVAGRRAPLASTSTFSQPRVPRR